MILKASAPSVKIKENAEICKEDFVSLLQIESINAYNIEVENATRIKLNMANAKTTI